MIQLKNNNLAITINEALGAALHSFTYNGQDVLRPTPDSVQRPQQQSLFLMLPYCSYIKDGKFNYFGINRHVPANDSTCTDPIHGDGCRAKWSIEKQFEDEVVLAYQHKKEDGFPFDYTAKVKYTLIDNQLKIMLSIYNPSELPMPCGMGVHPYFLNPESARLTFVSSHVWHHKNDPIFDRPYPTPNQWDFKNAEPLKEDFDTAFGGWDGSATINYRDQNLQVVMQAEDIFHHIILYYPKDANFFCLEPASNTPDAFNLAAYGVIGTGIQSIGGGQTLTKSITFTCSHT